MTTDLMTIEHAGPRDVSAEQLALIKIVGGVLHASRYYPSIASPDQAIFLMARVYELGFPATSAPDVIDNIQGRLALKPQAAWALVLKSGLLADMEVSEGADFCEIKLKRVGLSFWQGYRFTMDAARAAGLVKDGGAYEKWARNMLYWRALGFALDRAFPDVTLGLKDSIQFGAPIPPVRVTGEIVTVIDSQEG